MNELVFLKSKTPLTTSDANAKEAVDAVLDSVRATYPLRMDAETELGITDLNYMALCLRNVAEAFYRFEDTDEAVSETLNAFKEITCHMTAKESDMFLTLTHMARDFILTFFLVPSRKSSKATANSCVYVLQMDNNRVKIGVTSDFSRRLATITNNSGMTVKDWCHTSYINRTQALKIERRCHAHFQLQRAEGEFFNINFEDASTELEKYATITERFLTA